MKPWTQRIARPLTAGCLAGMVMATPLAGQVRARERSPGAPIVLQAADGTSFTLSSSALLVEGEPCLLLPELATALHGTPELAPSLALDGSTLRALEPRESKAVLGVRRTGVISTRVRAVQDHGGGPQTCVPVSDLARAMGGTWNGTSIEGFDSQIDGMMNSNVLFLAIQTKVQNVSQTTQLLSNIAKADSDAKLNVNRTIQTPMNMQVSLFEETESVLALAPASQVAWARKAASSPRWYEDFVIRGKNDAAEIQAAVRAAFPNDPPGMQAQTSLILQLILMGDVIGALRRYAVLMDRDMRSFSPTIIEKLDQVREARSTVIRNFARTRPPRAYAGQNPQTAARAQDRSQRYTQFVQMSTQLMNEVQNTERELVDALQTMHRDLDTLWQAYASMRDEEFRTNERIIQIR